MVDRIFDRSCRHSRDPEQPAPYSEKDIKIPDVCDQFNVAWVNTFDMLESLGIRFDVREDLVAT